MKKLISLTLALVLMVSLCVPALADGFNASLEIERTDSTITVTVQDSDVLQTEQPTLTIPCEFPDAVVTHNGETVESVLEGGKISFRVTEGGVYVITRSSQTEASGALLPILIAIGGAGGVSFRDVTAADYYYEAVLWAVANGITTGTGSGTFSPDQACTRAQVVTFLWRAAGCPAATGTNPFTDATANDYYYEAVLWAVANGITTGTGKTTFSPDAVVTRAQVVTFLWRAAGCPAAAGTNPFADVAADDYFHETVLWAVETGVTTGTSKTAFSPDAACTRAQVVTFLYRSAK